MNVGMRLFREQGFNATTMEQIADQVDVSKVTIYNYFPVKEAIVSDFFQAGSREVRDEKIPDLIKAFPDTKSRLLELFKRSHEWIKENREIYKIYFGYRMQNLLDSFRDESKRSGFEEVLAMIISVGQEAGELTSDLSATSLARHLEMMSGAALIEWWMHPDTFSFEKDFGATIDLFLNGARTKL
jgi:AcrR family transcriptional regulator